MEKKKKWVLLSLSIPAFLLIFIFMIVPLGNAVRVSFFKWNGYSQKMKFIGLENYISLFSDKVFWRSTFNTFIYGFGSTLLQNIFGLSAALFVNKQFKGRNFVRLILYMPIMISGVIMGAIQYYVFNYDNGVLNNMLNLIHLCAGYLCGIDVRTDHFSVLFCLQCAAGQRPESDLYHTAECI